MRVVAISPLLSATGEPEASSVAFDDGTAARVALPPALLTMKAIADAVTAQEQAQSSVAHPLVGAEVVAGSARQMLARLAMLATVRPTLAAAPTNTATLARVDKEIADIKAKLS